jgi:hypothetical protein
VPQPHTEFLSAHLSFGCLRRLPTASTASTRGNCCWAYAGAGQPWPINARLLCSRYGSIQGL